MLFVDWLIQSVSQILVTGTAWPRQCRDYAVPVTEAIALQNGKTRAYGFLVIVGFPFESFYSFRLVWHL